MWEDGMSVLSRESFAAFRTGPSLCGTTIAFVGTRALTPPPPKKNSSITAPSSSSQRGKSFHRTQRTQKDLLFSSSSFSSRGLHINCPEDFRLSGGRERKGNKLFLLLFFLEAATISLILIEKRGWKEGLSVVGKGLSFFSFREASKRREEGPNVVVTIVARQTHSLSQEG